MSERKEKFTPGPWSVRDKICIFRFLSVTSDKSPFVIAKIMQPDMQRILEDATKEKANWQQLSANAALIAAAPEMYELLDRIKGRLEFCKLENSIDAETEHEIDRLLRKARGEA
ncbi:MAG: hypothetical protein IJS08_13770 [Victivallales bacterium]|nr:hypothetical protein [Victivallales bacterium]